MYKSNWTDILGILVVGAAAYCFYTAFEDDLNSMRSVMYVLWGVIIMMLSIIVQPGNIAKGGVGLIIAVWVSWRAFHINLFWGLLSLIVVLIAVLVLIASIGMSKSKNTQSVATDGNQSKAERGVAFEMWCGEYLRSRGFSNVSMTKTSGDYGADLIAYDNFGNKWVFQCKCYQKSVGLSAVQEAIASKGHYNASRCGVMTNSYLTDGARQLALENSVEILEQLPY